MADFSEAYKITGHSEGGYANNPDDHGAETYAGISRKFWPAWPGWKIVDEKKIIARNNTTALNTLLANNTAMTAALAAFYKTNFWDINKLDLINNQQIADNIYDCGVNSGTGYAARVLQKAAGVTPDGIIGSKTIAAVNDDDPQLVYESINNQRVAKYRALAQNPGQLQFLKSWMSRIKEYQA